MKHTNKIRKEQMKFMLILLLSVTLISAFKPVSTWADEIENSIIVEATEENIGCELETDQLPPSYDPRPRGLVTSVKDQGSTGLCEKYAEIAAMESCLIKKGYENNSIDLSELHLAYELYKLMVKDKVDYSFYDFCMNSVHGISHDVLIEQNNLFPATESELPMVNLYQGYEPNTSNIGTPKYEIRKALFLADKSQDLIKQAIITYGGVTASTHIDNDTFYVPGSGKDATTYNYMDYTVDHEIEIIGWNDNFSASNFKHKPSGNGAWLCKNSWGAYKDSSGFVWISYCEGDIAGIAFDIAKRGATPREVVLNTEELTLYVGQTSNPIVKEVLPSTAEVKTCDIRMDGYEDYIRFNSNTSISLIKYPGGQFNTHRFRISTTDNNAGASFLLTYLPNEVKSDSLIMVPDNGRTDVKPYLYSTPVSSQISDVVISDGTNVTIEDGRYAKGKKYGKEAFKVMLNDTANWIYTYTYCTSLDMGEDITMKTNDGTSQRYVKPVFPLSENTKELMKAITYTSSDENIATVKNNEYYGAFIRAIAPGEATITATLCDPQLTNGKTITDTFKVTVTGEGNSGEGSEGGESGGNDPFTPTGDATNFYIYNEDGIKTTEGNINLVLTNLYDKSHNGLFIDFSTSSNADIPVNDLQYSFTDNSVASVSIDQVQYGEYDMFFSAIKPGKTDFTIKTAKGNTITLHITVKSAEGTDNPSQTTQQPTPATQQQPQTTQPTQNAQNPDKKAKENDDEELDPFTKNGIEYSVSGGEAEITDCFSKKSKITIPATIKYKGKTYKVTSIAASAFNGNRKIKTVVIGKNISYIGRKAFYGCKNLSTVKIQSKKLTYVGKAAFKKIKTGAKFSLPKAKKSKYKKMLGIK